MNIVINRAFTRLVASYQSLCSKFCVVAISPAGLLDTFVLFELSCLQMTNALTICGLGLCTVIELVTFVYCKTRIYFLTSNLSADWALFN